MEQKTMGSFIAVLRKSNGLTQKQLAEQLGVSDKTISHWERNESAPDISVIPVIADLFGVTCDELLKGERLTPEKQNAPETKQNTKKQMEYLLNKKLNGLLSKTLISCSAEIIGIIICIAFTEIVYTPKLSQAMLVGFGLITILLAAVFGVNYRFSLSNYSIDEALIKEYRKRGNAITIRVIYIIVVLTAFIFPLIRALFDLRFLINPYAAGIAILCIIADIILKSKGVIPKRKRK